MTGIEAALIATAVSTAVGVGTSLLINALTPAQVIKSGRLDDLSVPKNSYGATIPQCWGETELAGILLWATRFKEETITRRHGGKGGPKVESEETSYYGSFAVMLGYCPHRPAEALHRITLNGKLVYDATSTDPETIAESNEFLANHVRFYYGSADQEVDPLLQNAEPVQSYDFGLPNDATERQAFLTSLGLDPYLNHIPGYRQKCYVVIENLHLGPYGNQLPALKARVLWNSGNTLQTIVTDICNQAEINNIDVSGISDIPVSGYHLDTVTTASQALRLLQQCFFFDIISSGQTLKFIAEASSRDTIPILVEELAAHASGEKRPTTFELPRPDPIELPKSVEVNFIDSENYVTGNALARSGVATSTRRETYTFPVVMSAQTAQNIAENLLHKFYLQAIHPEELALSPRYSHLEVGDRLNIAFYGELYTLQIAKIKMGANRLLKLNTKVVEAANSTHLSSPPAPINDGGFTPPQPTIRTQGATHLEVMDINLISDSDEDFGLYVAANGGENWRECSIYISNDDSSYYFADTLTEGTIGTLASPLDESSTEFRVRLSSGSLESISDSDFDFGLNKILVGNEILQFRDRSLSGDDEELSVLRRGLRGTENYINNHAIGDRVVLLTGNGAVVNRIPGTIRDIGEVRYFKAPSVGQSLDASGAIPVTVEGNALKPYSPVNVTATVDSLGNISLSWDRRDRHAGSATTYENLPLSEFEEKWEIDIIFTDGTTIRTIDSQQSNTTYTASNQRADFGNLQDTINVRIYQISNVVGRGYSSDVTLTPSFYQPPPVVNKIIPLAVSIGDVVTLTGSGLAQVTSVRVAESEVTALSVVSDSEIFFTVLDPDTITSAISLFNDSPPTIPIYETEDVLNIISSGNGNGSGFTGFIEVTADLTITDEHKGKLLLVKTDSNDIAITFDYAILSEPENFDIHIQNDGDNKVLFVASAFDELLAKGFELTQKYDTASWYHQGFGIWRGIGALGGIDLAGYMQKVIYDPNNDGVIEASIDLSGYLDKATYDPENDGFATSNIDLSAYLTATEIQSAYMAKVDFIDSENLIKKSSIRRSIFSNAIDNTTTYTLTETDLIKEFLIINKTKTINIPNGTTFTDGWSCLVTLQGNLGDIEFQRADGSLTGLLFSNNKNHLKTQGTVEIRHLNNNVWFINGYLENE